MEVSKKRKRDCSIYEQLTLAPIKWFLKIFVRDVSIIIGYVQANTCIVAMIVS